MRNNLIAGLFEHAIFPQGIVPELYHTHAREYSRAMMSNRSFRKYAREFVDRTPTRDDSRQDMVLSGTREALNAVLDSDENNVFTLAAIVETWQLGPKDQMRFVERKLTSVVRWWVVERSEFCSEAKEYVALNLKPGKCSSRSIRASFGYQAYLSVSGARTVLRRPARKAPIPFWLAKDPAKDRLVVSMSLSELGFGRDGGYPHRAGLLVGKLVGHTNDAVTVQTWRNLMTLIESTPAATLESALEAARTLATAE